MGVKDALSSNKREIKDVFYLIALQGLNYIVPLLVLPYLMKVLGAEKFGYIGFSLAVAQYLMLLVDFGFNLSATKRIALAKDNQQELNKIFSATVYAKIGLLLLSFALLFVVSLVPEFAVYRTTMLVMFLVVMGQAGLFVFLFQGLGQIKWVSIFNGIAKVSVLPLTFWLVKSPDDYLWAAFLQGMVAIVAAVISWGMIAKNKWVKFVSVSWSNVKEELSESFPIFLSTAATSIYTACFVLILGYFATPQEVGQYSAVDRIMRALCYMALIPVLQVFYPHIASLAQQDKGLALKRVGYLFGVVVACMVLIGCCMVFASPYAITFLGDDYNHTDGLFAIMAAVPLFVGLGGVAGQLVLLAIGDSSYKNYFRNVYIVAGIVAISSVLVLSYFYGMYGTAFALLLTEITVCVLMISPVRKIYKS